MAYTTASHIDHDGLLSRVVKGVREFVSAWFEASAAYTAYRELSALSRAELAARGLRREDAGRVAMDLPTLIRE
ncbi:hypothetical protein [Roseomonas genomospecies 6]|uniref:DUF1127 domain-containing protein n=1 Tax=Roseomonas genomospecies 6 TaxID=214106 RepID=A0A9W7NLV6_9PROT|nr:hypothetical protein [Roseomonas genomospecies 6]KAA0682399.1 hypothetical protein DS843_07650 [Roseomonas genomospecies 6]